MREKFIIMITDFQILGVWQDIEFIIKAWRERSPVPWKRPLNQPLELLTNQIKQRVSKQASS
jgi:hypothetical protein